MEKILKFDIIRHSTKGPDGELTISGREGAIKYGVLISEEVKNVWIFTSDIQRCIDTGRLIAKGINKPCRRTVMSMLSEEPYTDERLERLGLSGGKWLLLGDEHDILPSTKYMAGKIASFILNSCETAKRYDEEIQILSISHVPTIMCFLGHILAESEGIASINNDIKQKLMGVFEGGFVKPLQGFSMRKLPNDYEITLVGKSIVVSNTYLSSLANAYVMRSK